MDDSLGIQGCVNLEVRVVEWEICPEFVTEEPSSNSLWARYIYLRANNFGKAMNPPLLLQAMD